MLDQQLSTLAGSACSETRSGQVVAMPVPAQSSVHRQAQTRYCYQDLLTLTVLMRIMTLSYAVDMLMLMLPESTLSIEGMLVTL